VERERERERERESEERGGWKRGRVLQELYIVKP
jgi:hypothetical protein